MRSSHFQLNVIWPDCSFKQLLYCNFLYILFRMKKESLMDFLRDANHVWRFQSYFGVKKVFKGIDRPFQGGGLRVASFDPYS
jgi:hypothetical protein